MSSCAEYDRSHPLFERSHVPCEFLSIPSTANINRNSNTHNAPLISSDSKRIVPCTLRLLEGRRRCAQTPQREERVIRFEVSDECSSVLMHHDSGTISSSHLDFVAAANIPNYTTHFLSHLNQSTTLSSSTANLDPTPSDKTLLHGENIIDSNRRSKPMMQLQEIFQHEQVTSSSHLNVCSTITPLGLGSGTQTQYTTDRMNNTGSGNANHSFATTSNLAASSKNCLMGPIRLFELEVGESDFVELRRDQALLVDFQKFAHSFVALLGYCDLGESYRSQEFNASDTHRGNGATSTSDSTVASSSSNLGRNPGSSTTIDSIMSSSITSKYTCRIEDYSNSSNLTFASTPRSNSHSYHSSTNGKIGAKFLVVESNQFRELTHLSLNLQVGTDSSIRQYLSTRLGQLMSENQILRTLLECESKRAIIAEDLFQQMDTKFHNLTITSDSELRQTREQLREQMEDAIRKQNYQYTSVLQEKETVLRSLKESMEIKLQRVEEQLKSEESFTFDLRNKIDELTNTNEELRNIVDKKDATIKETKQDVACTTSKIQQLERDNLTVKKRLQEAQGRIVTLEQSIEGKENILLQADVYKEASDKATAQANENLNMHRVQLEEARVQLATLTNEIIKITDLNVQLQKDKKDYKSKMKLRAKVIKRQEEILCEKDTLLANFEKKMERILIDRDKLQRINLAKGRELEAMKVKLTESVKASEKNKNVSAIFI